MQPEKSKSLAPEFPTFQTASGYELVFKRDEVLQSITLPVFRTDTTTQQLIKIGQRNGQISTWVNHLIGINVPSEQTISKEPILVEQPDGTRYYLDKPEIKKVRFVKFKQFLSLPPQDNNLNLFISLDIIEQYVWHTSYGDGITKSAEESLETTGVYYERSLNHSDQQTKYFLMTISMNVKNGNVQRWNILHQEPFFQKK